MSFIDVMHFRINSILCIEPIEKVDDLFLHTICIDEDGDVNISSAIAQNGFHSATLHNFEPPLVTNLFNNNETSVWPRTYRVFIYLGKRGLPDWLKNLISAVGDAVSSRIGMASMEDILLWFGDEGAAEAGSHLTELLARTILEEALRRAASANLSVGYVQLRFSDDEYISAPETPIQEIELTGHNARYAVSYSWRRLRFERNLHVPFDPIATELEVIIVTGQDSVRANSHVFFSNTYRSGASEAEQRLTGFESWNSHSIVARRFPLATPHHLSEISQILVRFQSGESFFLDTPDGWDLQSIVIRYIGPEHSGLLLSKRSNDERNPTHGYRGSGIWESMAFERGFTPDTPVTMRTADGRILKMQDYEYLLLGGYGVEVEHLLVVDDPIFSDGSEVFTLIQIGDSAFALRASNGFYVSTWHGILRANESSIARAEVFEFITNSVGRSVLRTKNGGFVFIDHNNNLSSQGTDMDSSSAFILELG